MASSTIPATANATKLTSSENCHAFPFAPDFRAFAEAGARLATIHVGYEEQPKYQLKLVETPDIPLDWRVEKMRLSKDKTQLRYNDFLTLDGIPAAAFGYRLGNRSALEWVIDQYRVKTDKRSGIVNDPNREDDRSILCVDREGDQCEFGDGEDCGGVAGVGGA